MSLQQSGVERLFQQSGEGRVFQPSGEGRVFQQSGKGRLVQQSGVERLFQQSGVVKFLQGLMLWIENAQPSTSYEKKDKAQKVDVILKDLQVHKLDVTNVLPQNIYPIVCEENTQNR